jgi:hypothetical protein
MTACAEQQGGNERGRDSHARPHGKWIVARNCVSRAVGRVWHGIDPVSGRRRAIS